MSKIGQIMNLLLKEKNMNIETLAKESGVTRQGITNIIKSGDTKISTLLKISDALEVNPTVFINTSIADFQSDLLYFLTKHNSTHEISELISNFDYDFFIERLGYIYLDMMYLKPGLFERLHLDKSIVYRITQNKYFDFYMTDKRGNNIYPDEAWVHPLRLNDFFETYFSPLTDDVLEFLAGDIEEREKRFVEYTEESPFIIWLFEVGVLDSRAIKSIIAELSRNLHPIIYYTRPNFKMNNRIPIEELKNSFDRNDWLNNQELMSIYGSCSEKDLHTVRQENKIRHILNPENNNEYLYYKRDVENEFENGVVKKKKSKEDLE